MPSTMKLILVCKEGAARQAYLNETKALGVEVDAVSSFYEFLQQMYCNPYQGLLIDLVTQMKMSLEEKNVSKEILGFFPTIQLKWHAESGSIKNISYGKTTTCRTLQEFIHMECPSFTPRAVRLNTRKMFHLNVLLSTDESMHEKFLERTVTVNISKSGCFLFSCKDWSNCKNAWFIANELRDKTPIAGNVRWSVEWGKLTMIPGIGISFNHIKQSQIEEWIEKCALLE
jgi:hypothetical protein